ncbi:MAG: hypothetical protein ACREBG_18885 [Pyrinomonadaceae bacterium]
MINKTKTECETKLCHYDSATRTRFYNGMLLTAEHLRAEQAYHREALKRVNRHLFGSGIVCGLDVKGQDTGLCIKVHPGVALDCCGNLIEVCKCITIDLSKECKDRYGSDCIPNAQKPDQYTFMKYLVLRYDEKPTDPEPVLTPADDCKPAGDKPNCEASKIREGFCVELWDECPCPEPQPEVGKSLLATIVESNERYQQQAAMTPQQVGIHQQPDIVNELRPCSPCGCCENAVGLAKLTIHCDTNIVDVDLKSCRRYVIDPRFVRSLFSNVSPTYIPKDMEDLHSQLGDRATANMVLAAVEVEESGKQIKELQDAVKQIKELQNAVKPIKELQNAVKQIKELQNAVKPIKELKDAVKQLTKQVKSTP